MHRIDHATADPDLHGEGKAGFVPGDPDNDVPATRFTPDWCNDVQENVAGVIEGAGIALVKGDDTQLTDAINTLIAAALAAYTPPAPAFDVPFLAGYGADMTGEDLAVRAYGRVKVARAITIQDLVAELLVAATGAALILDVLRNGVSIWTVKPQFAAGSTVLTPGTLDPAQADCDAGDVLSFEITQIGSTIKGQKLAVTIQGEEA